MNMEYNSIVNLLTGLFFISWCHCSRNLSTPVLVVDGDSAKISLSGYDTSSHRDQVFTRMAILAPSSYLGINVIDIPEIVSFVTIQIHTYQYNVTMAYDRSSLDTNSNQSVLGTNIGLVVKTDTKSVAQVFFKNWNTDLVQSLIAVVAFTAKAPLPGGCNMEFDTEIAPFQKLVVNDATVVVKAQPASAPAAKGVRPSCERQSVHHDMFRMYLWEQDFSPNSYFLSIAKMLTVRDVIQNGDQMPASISGSPMKRVYSAYPGTGSVFAVVATYGDYSSAYVPMFTYACSPLFLTDSCQVLTTFSKILCAIVLFLGLLITFAGHIFFKTEIFLLGFLSGGLIGYVIVLAIVDWGSSGLSLVFGLFTGIGWLQLWRSFGIPILSIFLVTLTLGFFWASIIYYSLPGLVLPENDTNFWLIFTLIGLMVPISLCATPFHASIISCAIIGSYATIVPIDYYIGSSLKYIIINMMRRATVPGYNVAIIRPPFQTNDVCLTLFCTFLAGVGVYVQLRQNRGKPPFPPASSRSWFELNERMPLLPFFRPSSSRLLLM